MIHSFPPSGDCDAQAVGMSPNAVCWVHRSPDRSTNSDSDRSSKTRSTTSLALSCGCLFATASPPPREGSSKATTTKRRIERRLAWVASFDRVCVNGDLDHLPSEHHSTGSYRSWLFHRFEMNFESIHRNTDFNDRKSKRTEHQEKACRKGNDARYSQSDAKESECTTYSRRDCLLPKAACRE